MNRTKWPCVRSLVSVRLPVRITATVRPPGIQSIRSAFQPRFPPWALSLMRTVMTGIRMAMVGIGTPLTRSVGCHSGFAARSRLIRSCKSLSPLRWDCSGCDSELLRDLGSSRSGKSQKLNVTTQQPSHEESTISRLQQSSSDVTGAQPRAAASSSSSSERRRRARDTMRRPSEVSGAIVAARQLGVITPEQV